MPPVLIATEHDKRLQVGYLRKMEICIHLRRAAFPQRCTEGTHRQKSAVRGHGWQVASLCKLSRGCRFSRCCLGACIKIWHSGKSITVVIQWDAAHIADLFSSSPEGRSVALPETAQPRHMATHFENGYKSRDKKSLVMENMPLADI